MAFSHHSWTSQPLHEVTTHQSRRALFAESNLNCSHCPVLHVGMQLWSEARRSPLKNPWYRLATNGRIVPTNKNCFRLIQAENKFLNRFWEKMGSSKRDLLSSFFLPPPSLSVGAPKTGVYAAFRYQFVCRSAGLSVCPFVCLSVRLSVCLSVPLSVCPSVCLSVSVTYYVLKH